MKYIVKFYASRGSELFKKFMEYHFFEKNCGSYHSELETHSNKGVLELTYKTDNEKIKNELEKMIREYAA